MSPTAGDILRKSNSVLLDFDGPMTPLMPPPENADAADAARKPLIGVVDMPQWLATTSDHLAVLRYAAGVGPHLLADVEDACTGAEVDAARHSEPTPGSIELLQVCHATDRQVVVVSNNSADAVNTYLRRFELHHLVRGVVGRQPGRPDLMKPHPSLVLAALNLFPFARPKPVLIGDSFSDVEAAHAANAKAIGYAKTPERGRELADVGADAVASSMGELAAALLD